MVTQRRGQAAFTLIELMITLAILVILTTLAVPGFNGYISNQRVKSAAYDLIATFNYARSEAVKRNEPVTISADASDWSNGWAITAGGKTLQTYEADNSVSIAESNSQFSITYKGNGRLSNSTKPAVTICDPNLSSSVTKRVIHLDLTGRPNLKKDGACA
ncbi:GspH/FimT family pseudopilin [Thiohalomonas denitrificans]|nr:GspH/FimT family pseudopilin [Thiohalomonas denitrificans]